MVIQHFQEKKNEEYGYNKIYQREDNSITPLQKYETI